MVNMPLFRESHSLISPFLLIVPSMRIRIRNEAIHNKLRSPIGRVYEEEHEKPGGLYMEMIEGDLLDRHRVSRWRLR